MHKAFMCNALEFLRKLELRGFGVSLVMVVVSLKWILLKTYGTVEATKKKIKYTLECKIAIIKEQCEKNNFERETKEIEYLKLKLPLQRGT